MSPTNAAAQDSDDLACRLCSAATRSKFHLTVLGHHDVGYYACTKCGSLQTERPYWLAEAYAGDAGSHDNLNTLDTGAAQRNLANMAVTLTVAKALGLHNTVDEGGGDGLLCRLLRDHELNAFVRDRYARPVYAQGFETPDFAVPDLITAFEVFEHFADPVTDVAELFRLRPQAILITTEAYGGQGSDWWYLIPETGHHVFFYGERAFAMIAERFGYDLLRVGGYTLFTRHGVMTKGTRSRLRLLLRPRMLRLIRGMIALRAPLGAGKDFERARAALPRT